MSFGIVKVGGINRLTNSWLVLGSAWPYRAWHPRGRHGQTAEAGPGLKCLSPPW